VNGKKINPKNINFIEKKVQQKSKEKTPSFVFPKLSAEKLKQMSQLAKEEPAVSVRRLSNRVIYELAVPGVKSLKDVSVAQRENSIEVKALAKDKVYFKIVPLGFPILDCNLLKGKLILELESWE